MQALSRRVTEVGLTVLQRLFTPRPETLAGRRLYAAAVAQARSPAFYRDAGVPDTPEGRFELYSLHVVLILHRLKDQGRRAADISQALFDAYIRSLDDALRDLGVGDLSVGKKMRKLGEAFYGRVKSYDAALGPPPDGEALKALIERTVLAETDAAGSSALVDYVLRAAETRAATPAESLLEADPSWPAFAL